MGTEHNAEYYFDRARRKINAKDVKGGLADLNQAILLSPTTVEYYVERARQRLYFELERQSTAEDNNKVFQLQLNDTSTIIELGTELDDLEFAHEERSFCYGQLGRYQERIAELDWLIDHEYNLTDNYGWRAKSEFQLGNFEHALRDYTTCLQLDPDYTDALFGRSKVYYSIQRYQEALDDLNKLLSFEQQQQTNSSITYSWRGRTYYKLGNEREAREDFTKSTILDGGTPLDISAADYMRILFSED